MSTKAYIIHLSRARRRLPLARALAAKMPFPTKLLPAVDAAEMSSAEARAAYRQWLHWPRYPFALCATEIACFLSHRLAWQAIVADACDVGIICEDDVVASSDEFPRLLQAAVNTTRPDEYVRLPICGRQEKGAEVRSLDGVMLIEPRLPRLGMQMQIVGREAARRLLDASATFDRPVDAFLQMRWVHGVRVLSALPIMVGEVSEQHGGSTVQRSRKNFLHRLSHESTRPLLRLAIHLQNTVWLRRRAA